MIDNNYGQFVLLDDDIEQQNYDDNNSQSTNTLDIENMNDSRFEDFGYEYEFTEHSYNNKNIIRTLFYNAYCVWKIFEIFVFKDKSNNIEE